MITNLVTVREDDLLDFAEDFDEVESFPPFAG